MESNIEIILMGSINRLIESFDESINHDCINIYRDFNNLLVISHDYDDLLYFMKTSDEFKNRKYVLKELNEEEENRYLTLFNMTDLETIKDIMYEELKDLPTTNYPREE